MIIYKYINLVLKVLKSSEIQNINKKNYKTIQKMSNNNYMNK